jgi:hypothetical protein
MLLVGAAFAGAGVAVIAWPRLLAWVAGGALALLGLFFAVSAVLARGPRR